MFETPLVIIHVVFNVQKKKKHNTNDIRDT